METLNEIELLERNIIKKYNGILKMLLDEGDMKALEKVITDDEYRNELMSAYSVSKLGQIGGL